jgi:thioredoxin 1
MLLIVVILTIKRRNQMPSYVNVTDDEFEAVVLKSEIPVFVDFWAPWCAPCVRLTPFIEQLGTQYAGKLKVVKVNVDENSEYAAQYGVQGIPNMILFKNGEVVDTLVGLPANTMKALIDFVTPAL